MHEIHAERLLSSVRAGRRVLVLAESVTAGRGYFEGMLEQLKDEVLEVRRASAREKIALRSGGAVWFLPLRSVVAARGLSLDEVYVPLGAGPGVVASVVPCLAASPVGWITGY